MAVEFLGARCLAGGCTQRLHVSARQNSFIESHATMDGGGPIGWGVASRAGRRLYVNSCEAEAQWLRD